MMAARALLTRSPGAPPVTCWWLGRSTHPHAERGGGTAAGIALARRARAAAGGGAGGGWRQHRRLRRRRAICGCWGGIVSSAATAPWRPTLRVCSVASRRTLWSPTRPTAFDTLLPDDAVAVMRRVLADPGTALAGFTPLLIGGARAEREDPKLVGAFNGSRVVSSKFT